MKDEVKEPAPPIHVAANRLVSSTHSMHDNLVSVVLGKRANDYRTKIVETEQRLFELFSKHARRKKS